MTIVEEIRVAQLRLDEKWGGPESDDRHPIESFAQTIQDYAHYAAAAAAGGDHMLCRQFLVQAAAVAASAVESLERRMEAPSAAARNRARG